MRAGLSGALSLHGDRVSRSTFGCDKMLFSCLRSGWEMVPTLALPAGVAQRNGATKLQRLEAS